jgi:hypothetical protein
VRYLCEQASAAGRQCHDRFVGLDNTFVVAQWDRPLTSLAVNNRIEPEDVREPDPNLSWTRADGWQCYAPLGGYYDGALVPPVRDITEETRGLVLGIGVARSDHYRISFLQDGEIQTLANGWYHEYEQSDFEREVVNGWGEPWRVRAAEGLKRWAEPIADVSWLGLFAAIRVPRVFAEATIYDVLRLLTLVPDPNDPPWWHDIPGADYAVDGNDISDPTRTSLPRGVIPRHNIVLAFTADGPGVWSMERARWASPPAHDADQLLTLRRELQRQNWPPRR